MKKKLLFAASTIFLLITVQAQVTQINANNSLFVKYPLSTLKTIAVSDIDSSIWVTEGTTASTIQISSSIKFEEIGALLSGKLIFKGSTSATGSELYITDGTSGGTMLVKDINAGAAGSAPADFAVLNGFIYFSAQTLAEGRELWKTNGTTAGTTLLKDIIAGAASSNQANKYNIFTNGISYFLFTANTTAEGLELWKSDGTIAGTVLLKDINTGVQSSNPGNFSPLNSSTILFTAKDASHGNEIWKTDGSEAGTALVKDINPGPGSSTALELFPGFSIPIFRDFHLFNNKAYFSATGNGATTGEMWVTDGTTSNTTLIKNLLPAAAFSSILLSNAVNLPGKFIFSVSDGASESGLWQSDGTPNGTTLFKSFSAANNSFPYILINYLYDINNGTITYPLFQGDKFFFTARTVAEGNELWISDGTLANTKLVKDINPGTADAFSFPSYSFTADSLFFTSDNGVNGNELWKTDGTLAGTVLEADINVGAGNSDPQLSFINSNSKVIFSANDGDNVPSDLFVIGGGAVSPPTYPCPGGNISLTANISGASYQWQVNTGAGFVNISNNTTYTGAATATLQINNAPSSFYGYQYRCNVVGNYSTTTSLKFVNIWNGSASNLWSNPANWSCNTVPDANTDAVINTGTAVLNVNGTCRSISVSKAATFTVGTGFTLQVTK
jgi:ELWxxDGT repeat protein